MPGEDPFNPETLAKSGPAGIVQKAAPICAESNQAPQTIIRTISTKDSNIFSDRSGTHFGSTQDLQFRSLKRSLLPTLSTEAVQAPEPATRSLSVSAIIVGPVIAFVSLVSYFMVFARFPVLRDVPWLNAPLALLGCYLSIRALMVALKNRQQWLRLSFSGLGLLFSVGISSLFFFYITVLSYQMPKGGKTESDLGQIPNIESTTHTGAPFTSADLGGKNWVIVFYRGHW